MCIFKNLKINIHLTWHFFPNPINKKKGAHLGVISVFLLLLSSLASSVLTECHSRLSCLFPSSISFILHQFGLYSLGLTFLLQIIFLQTTITLKIIADVAYRVLPNDPSFFSSSRVLYTLLFLSSHNFHLSIPGFFSFLQHIFSIEICVHTPHNISTKLKDLY